MADSDQVDIDALQKELTEKEGSPSEGEAAQDAQAAQDAPTDPAAAAAESAEGIPQKDPRGVPWVDFVPEFTHKWPETLDGCLAEHMLNLNDHLGEKELQRLTALDKGAHAAYLRLWVRDGNGILRTLVRTKRRRAFLKEKERGINSKEGVA